MVEFVRWREPVAYYGRLVWRAAAKSPKMKM